MLNILSTYYDTIAVNFFIAINKSKGSSNIIKPVATKIQLFFPNKRFKQLRSISNSIPIYSRTIYFHPGFSPV